MADHDSSGGAGAMYRVEERGAVSQVGGFGGQRQGLAGGRFGRVWSVSGGNWFTTGFKVQY